ncbi:proline--tRNA ligase [Conexibacter sp. SYSU D00693]|uniref:proline--tRNA ligase n=1 Tax=Conexibacter sp. SYSU D00693 TaxID=2812560 RepID=UPI00196AA0A4|nr:proline--tRNA ligase [Conexibacter sp. SYSU D00693]
MRFTNLLLPTERQPPADAEALSHKLMVRAGLVRQLGAGFWTWLPAGWKVHQKVVGIVRQEMDAIGCQELLMPVLQPRELWRRTGRDQINELFKLKDRKDAELVLAMTHEEAVTFHVAQVVRSYRDLPFSLYHFQVKERDEPRPRAGVLRTREFIMKDAYTFDRDQAGLDAAYEQFRLAYHRVYERCGLEYYECESDSGMMGGSGAQEFMAPCAAGEDDVVLAPGYSANLEIASAEPQPAPPLTLSGELETPTQKTIADVAGHLGVAESNCLKAFPVVTDGGELVLVLLRGDHQVAPIKLQNALGEPYRPAGDDELPGPAGFLGPKPGVRTVVDAALTGGPWVAGANREGRHVVVDHLDGERADVREVRAGDTVNGHEVRIDKAIEVGNIFKLGTRYSEPLGATYLDEHGKEHPIVMGSYGIGPARIAAAAVEQHGDDSGIAWPRSIAPFDVEVVALGKPGTPERATAEAVYEELRTGGLDAVLDDRDASPGEKFKDAELLGCPVRLTIGKRSAESGRAEAQLRRGLADQEEGVPLEGALSAVQELWRSAP